MIRLIAIRVLLSIAGFAFTSPASAELLDLAPAGAPVLKARVTVTSEIVRIGDLVANAGAVADVPIFRAPDLGQTGTVAAARVVEAVRPHHIIGLDTAGLTEVVVMRASRTVGVKEIEARILQALAGQFGLGEAKDLAIVFDNDVRTLQADPHATAELAVRRLAFDPRSRRFDVTLEMPGMQRLASLRFTGSVQETVETAVLVRPLAQNAVIASSDVAFERRPKSELTPNTIMRPDELVGLSLRHAMRPGVVRRSDVAKPELVGRNEAVTITFEVPGILLTVRGKALEPGAGGDIISVLNVQSNRTIQATVTGPGRVSVVANSPRVASTAPVLASSNYRRTAE